MVRTMFQGFSIPGREKQKAYSEEIMKIIKIILIASISLNVLFFLGNYVNQNDKLILPQYSFDNLDDFNVIVKGTWTSDTNLASKGAQTTYLFCRKSENFCTDYTAFYGFMRDKALSIYPTLYNIDAWSSEKITAANSAMCVNYNLTVDLKNKTVVAVRATKNPKPKGCEDIKDEPIYLHLK